MPFDRRHRTRVPTGQNADASHATSRCAKAPAARCLAAHCSTASSRRGSTSRQYVAPGSVFASVSNKDPARRSPSSVVWFPPIGRRSDRGLTCAANRPRAPGPRGEVPKHSVYGSVMFRIPNHHMQMRVSGAHANIGRRPVADGNTREKISGVADEPPRAADGRGRDAETLPARTIGDVILARFQPTRGFARTRRRGRAGDPGAGRRDGIRPQRPRRGVRRRSISRRSRTGIPRRTPSPTAIGRRRWIRWGDPVEPGAPAFDPLGQTAAAQRSNGATTTSSPGCRCPPARTAPGAASSA